jgi:hypothetical protein
MTNHERTTMTTPTLRAVPRPPTKHPKVSYNVSVNSHYPETPYEVAIVVRAASPEAASDALDKVWGAVDGQLTALAQSGWVPRV